MINGYKSADMYRRTYIKMTGAAIGSVALAGCSGGDGTGDSGGGDGNGGGSSDDTPTPTPTPESEYVEEDFESPFVVGSGEQSIEYRVTDAILADEIGGQYSSEEANGIFVIVVLEMTNVGDESIDITSNHLKAMNEDGQTFDADAGTTVYLETDDRFSAEGIAFEQLNPGLATEGAVIFDVVPGDYYYLLIEPAGLFSAASPHIVPLGTAE